MIPAEDLARALASLLALPDQLARVEARLARIEEAQRPRPAPPATGEGPDDLLTSEEAARVASVTAATVREWARSGGLRAARAPGSRRLRIRRGDLAVYLRGLDGEATARAADLDAMADRVVRRRRT